MSYQVLARKWRPQRFETSSGSSTSRPRSATRWPAAGWRRRSCSPGARRRQDHDGADPGAGAELREGADRRSVRRVRACVEIAQGRDLDVLEIDAATHTGVDNVRDVIISNLAIRPRSRPLQGLRD
jgi:DNA polymerase-3 subunit gamma/tau